MKKVQLGRSRMAEEMARPSWGITAKEKATADHISQKSHDKNEGKVAMIAAVVKEKEKLRVAAYARVSTDLDSQETSIENQREHYLPSRTRESITFIILKDMRIGNLQAFMRNPG